MGLGARPLDRYARGGRRRSCGPARRPDAAESETAGPHGIKHPPASRFGIRRFRRAASLDAADKAFRQLPARMPAGAPFLDARRPIWTRRASSAGAPRRSPGAAKRRRGTRDQESLGITSSGRLPSLP